MYSAQAQLADAYITGGQGAEARFIAEDLVAREPWDRANIERFRRALVLLGEPDPDGVIAERLSGQSPFMSTDVSLKGEELPPFEVVTELSTISEDSASDASNAMDLTSALDGVSANDPQAAAGGDLELTDIRAMVGDGDQAITAHSRSQSVEVDLSVVLDGVTKPIVTEQPSNAQPTPPAAVSDLDGVFAQMREESARRSSVGGADDEYKRAIALIEAGQIDDAIVALKTASKAPRLRFATAARLGRLFRDRGMLPQSVEWFERAAESTAPSPDEGHQLLYELAEALEATGETARALAICIELQAEAGNFRDVADRVNRLAKVQTRG